MKYKDLIQFDPIDEIIKFGQLNNEDYRAKLVKTFVCSEPYETYVIPKICATLDLNTTKETKGIQIVGNYGTGKSHLMSLFSIIAEDDKYLDLLQSQKAKDWLKTIAGQYKVHRFELGNNQELWDIVCYQIDKALADWGVDYSISDDATPATYSEKLQRMMAAFEDVYGNKGFMLVIDEMLSYLKGRSEPALLNRDLAVLQALGQMSDRTHFRMVFGVQELIYRSPEFQFAKEMLAHVNERYIDLTIRKEDVQFIVQQRLLQKDEHQKVQIREHLAKFTKMFPHMSNYLDTYVNLFPVHPSYFENFSLIRIGKSQREVLKTLSRKFAAMIEDDVPETEPGLICYDSYWQDMLGNVDLKADPDVSKVSDITDLVNQKIDTNFTKGLAPKKKLAHRIVAASAIKMLQAELSHANGVTAESLVNDLCHIDSTCDTYDDLVDLAITRVLEAIVSATMGQYFEKGENEYHLRIEGGVNYEQRVKDYTRQMSPAQKDEYFFKFLSEVLPVDGDTYRTGFNIWPHEIEWQTHKCTRDGYIFMGNPNSRSTTHPQRLFYIYFLPIFNDADKRHDAETDSVYFIMDGLSEEFKQRVTLYGSALSQEGSASSDEKPKYKLLRDKYFKETRDLFNNQFLECIQVEYIGEQHPLNGLPGTQGDSKIDIVSDVTSFILENQFESNNPDYPKFTALTQPLAKINRENMLRSARTKVANPTQLNRNGEAVLMALGLWEDGALSTEHSQYARSLKQKLNAQGGKVLNRDEILECFWNETCEYVSKDFHIEADLEMLVMGTMAALGELEIVLSGGTCLNAANISNFNSITSQDCYTFSNVRPPKGINIPLIRELMKGFLGADRTSELDNPNSSVFADLSSEAKRIEDRVVVLQHKIQGGYHFAGDIEIISDNEARQMNLNFDRLKGIANKMQRCNTKAKMRNIDWPEDVVRTAMGETRQMLEDTERMLKQVEEFQSYISYFRTALSNITLPDLRDDVNNAISKVKEVIRLDENARDAYKKELDALKGHYADWYMAEYVKAHIREIEFKKAETLKTNDKSTICEIVSEVPFVNPSRYYSWKEKIGRLKPANPNVTKEAILSMPTSVDSFNPAITTGQLPSFGELKDEQEDIFEDFLAQFKEALEDPTTENNRDMLTSDEKSLVEKFGNDTITLDRHTARPLADAIAKLQRSFTKIEITHEDMLRIFSRPMTKQQAIDALTAYIQQKSQGHRPEDIRIIIK